MKNKLLLLLLTLMIIIPISTVKAETKVSEAKKCFYRYYSHQYGYSYVVVNIRANGENPQAFITTFNSKDIDGSGKGNLEKAVQFDYEVYKQKNYVCPYYAAVNMQGDADVRVAWVYGAAKIWDNDTDENHILISTTIEQDKKANNDVYYDATDNYISGNDVGVDMWDMKIDTTDPNKYRTCSYVLPESDRAYGWGYTEVDVIIGPSTRNGSTNGQTVMFAGAHMVDGKETGGNNQFKEDEIADPTGIMASSKANLKCPYYVYYSTKGTNTPTILNSPSGYKTDYVVDNWAVSKPAFLLVLTTIQDEKPDFNSSDLVPGTMDDEQNRAYKRARDLGWTTTDGDEDPFSYRNGTVGDNFCSQPETVRASKLLGYFVILSRALIPFIIIIWGVMDFAKVVTQGKTDSLKKEATTFGIRVLLGIFVFFIPTIIYALFTSFIYFNVVSSEYEKCAKCIFHPLRAGSCEVTSSTSGSTSTTTTIQAGNSARGALTTQVTQQLNPGVILIDPDKK